MIVTKHISLDKDCIDKINPYVEKHSGNFSAAIREIIDRAGESGLPANSFAFDRSFFKWVLEEINGILLPDNVIDEMIDPGLMNSMEKLEEFVNFRFTQLEWDIDLVLKYDKNSFPTGVMIEIKGAPQDIRFVAILLSQFLVKNSMDHSPLEIKYVGNFNNCIKVELVRSNKPEAINSLNNYFGNMDNVFKSIKHHPVFWKSVIRRHELSNYNMVTVHRNYFEDILAGKVPMGEISIENLARKPIEEIPLKEMLDLIKEIYETSRVVERIEVDRDSLILYHNYRNNVAIEKIKQSLFSLLEANGHIYDVKSTANMIVLTHRPEIGVKINEIVENLKKSDEKVDHELIMFLSFLQELKKIPDIPLSLTSLGNRIGKSFMQEFEKENEIKHWELETFKQAMEIIDLKLHRESEWKVNGNNLLYRINKCNIATEGNTFDTYVCHTARETFKGALNYAFGNKAELCVNKLLSHGDNYCEVIIQIL